MRVRVHRRADVDLVIGEGHVFGVEETPVPGRLRLYLRSLFGSMNPYPFSLTKNYGRWTTSPELLPDLASPLICRD